MSRSVLTVHISGKDGNLSCGGDKLARMVGWTVDYEIDIYGGAPDDSNWEKSTTGNRRWSGSVTVEADEGTVSAALAPVILAGAAIAFNGSQAISDGQNYVGQILLGGAIGIGADTESGKIEEITYPFVGNGPLSIAS